MEEIVLPVVVKRATAASGNFSTLAQSAKAFGVTRWPGCAQARRRFYGIEYTP